MHGTGYLLVAVTSLALFVSGLSASALGKEFTGVAHWYGPGFHGKKAACGKRFDKDGITAAHADLPFGTKVRVTSIKTGKSTVVEITDRCAHMKHRVIDLSEGAAKAIGIYPSGSSRVKCEVVTD